MGTQYYRMTEPKPNSWLSGVNKEIYEFLKEKNALVFSLVSCNADSDVKSIKTWPEGKIINVADLRNSGGERLSTLNIIFCNDDFREGTVVKNHWVPGEVSQAERIQDRIEIRNETAVQKYTREYEDAKAALAEAERVLETAKQKLKDFISRL